MGVTLELLSIAYLCSMTSFRLILMCYATIACIAHFDDLYSNSLGDHPIRNVIGKKFYVAYKRCMTFEPEKIRKAIHAKIEEKKLNRIRRKKVDGGAAGLMLHEEDMIDEDRELGAEEYEAPEGEGAEGAGEGAGGEGAGDAGGMEGGIYYQAEPTEKLALEALDDDIIKRQSCCLMFLKYTQKWARMIYMSFYFYFAPFLMLIYQFYLNNQARQERLDEAAAAAADAL